jgi:hypothetical protein
MLTDPYETGYRDGESSGHADWHLALGDLLPDDVEPTPQMVHDMLVAARADADRLAKALRDLHSKKANLAFYDEHAALAAHDAEVAGR